MLVIVTRESLSGDIRRIWRFQYDADRHALVLHQFEDWHQEGRRWRARRRYYRLRRGNGLLPCELPQVPPDVAEEALARFKADLGVEVAAA